MVRMKDKITVGSSKLFTRLERTLFPFKKKNGSGALNQRFTMASSRWRPPRGCLFVSVVSVSQK